MSDQSSPSRALVSSPLLVATVRTDVDEGAGMLHDHEMCAVTVRGSCG